MNLEIPAWEQGVAISRTPGLGEGLATCYGHRLANVGGPKLSWFRYLQSSLTGPSLVVRFLGCVGAVPRRERLVRSQLLWGLLTAIVWRVPTWAASLACPVT